MNILIINPILYTVDDDKEWPECKSIKDTMIYGMALGFLESGHKVTLAACGDYAPSEPETYDFDVIFFKSSLAKIARPARLPMSYDFIKYLIKTHRSFDLIIASECFQLYTLTASLICPQKTVIWQELSAHQHFMHSIPSKIWHNIIIPLMMRKISGIIPRSIPARDFISKYSNRVSSETVDHGIDLSKFPLSEIKKRQLISSCQLIQRKRVDEIIRQFALFHQIKGYEDIVLIIAGRGTEESNLKKLADELNINEFVRFMGFLPRKELGKIISESLAFLINTQQDLNIVSIPESICAGTPVLTTSVTALSQYINDNKIGMAKKGWNANDLKDIVDNSSLLSNNCRSLRDTLSSKYASQKIISISSRLAMQ